MDLGPTVGQGTFVFGWRGDALPEPSSATPDYHASMPDRMPADRQEKNVAILMDFENTKDANLQRILSHAAAYGQVIIRRAYADWTRHANASNRLREAGFEAVHQFTTGAGSKNATDINLTVDGMDILWSRPVDVFVVVTADSDFAKLAMRFREGGKLVVGIGAKGRVGRALVQACDHYIYYDDAVQKKRKSRGGREAEKETGPEKEPSKPPKEPKKEEPKREAAKEPGKKPSKSDVTKRHMIVLNSLEAAADSEGWVYGSPLHRSIKRLEPDFDYRDHGSSTFRGFIDSLAPVFQTETDPERSDFLVWIADEYEDIAWEAVEEKDREVNASDAATAESDVILAEEVQDRIDAEWEKLAGKRGRIPGSKAGGVVAQEYAVDKLNDTPLGSLDGVLDAAPKLAKKWKRDKAQIIRK